MFANAKMFGWYVNLGTEALSLFKSAFSMHRLSALNCARIYNEALANVNAYILNNRLAFASIYSSTERVAPTWPWPLQLRNEDVLNSFFLYSLLLDTAERRTCLILGDDVQNARLRLEPALSARNKRMEGIGQEAYTHACDLCYIIIQGEDGNLCKLIYMHLDIQAWAKIS